jgi:hypothetical protein
MNDIHLPRAVYPTTRRSRVSEQVLEAAGRQLLAEIHLQQPHIIADGYYGSVSIPGSDRILEGPWPTSDRGMLYVLAHEVGHWVLHTERGPVGNWTWRLGYLDYEGEYEAEQYAHKRLRNFGIAVPKDETECAKANVRQHIRRFLDYGSRLPCAKISKWAGVDIEAERRLEWGFVMSRMLRRMPADDTCAVDLVVGYFDRWIEPNDGVLVIARSDLGRLWGAENPTLLERGQTGKLTVAAGRVAEMLEKCRQDKLELRRA